MLWALGLLSLGVAGLRLLANTATERRQEHLAADHSLARTASGQIEYQRWGNGPPVLVLHGAGGGFDQGRLLAATLGGERFNWLAVSRFGYLESALPDDPSVTAQADTLLELLDQLHLERVHILAMSGGVPPALKLAEHHPGRIDRMILLSAAPFTPFGPDVADRPVPTWMYEALLGNDVIYWLLTKVARGTLEAAFDARAELRSPPVPAEEAFIGALVDGFLPASQRLAGVRNEQAAVDPAATYALERIRSEVLIVHARDDRLNPFAVSEALGRRIDQAELLALETGGHLLLGHHESLRRVIRQHLQDPRPDKRGTSDRDGTNSSSRNGRH